MLGTIDVGFALRVGTGGEVNYSAEDHLGLSLDAFTMLEIRDGEWTIVE